MALGHSKEIGEVHAAKFRILDGAVGQDGDVSTQNLMLNISVDSELYLSGMDEEQSAEHVRKLACAFIEKLGKDFPAQGYIDRCHTLPQGSFMQLVTISSEDKKPEDYSNFAITAAAMKTMPLQDIEALAAAHAKSRKSSYLSAAEMSEAMTAAIRRTELGQILGAVKEWVDGHYFMDGIRDEEQDAMYLELRKKILKKLNEKEQGEGWKL